MAQSPRRSRKAAVPTPSRGGGRRPYFDPLIDGAVCGPTPQGGLSWPVGPIHLLWTSAPTGCNTSFVGRGILDAPTRPPSGAVRDAGPYAGGGRQCSTAAPIGPWKMATAYRRRHTQVPPYEHGRTADVGDVGRDRCVPPSVQVTMIPWCGDGRWPAAGGCAICGWRFGRWGISPAAAGGCFAGCGQREFRALRGATRGAAFGNRDLGNAPPVGKRCRRGILCQSKAQLCRHTGCMARS